MSSANKHNKVTFNISNVHYAPLSQDNDGKYTWAAPVALPGAVSLSLDPQGEPESFYADSIEYYVINNNQGYDGDREVQTETLTVKARPLSTGYVKATPPRPASTTTGTRVCISLRTPRWRMRTLPPLAVKGKEG